MAEQWGKRAEIAEHNAKYATASLFDLDSPAE